MKIIKISILSSILVLNVKVKCSTLSTENVSVRIADKRQMIAVNWFSVRLRISRYSYKSFRYQYDWFKACMASTWFQFATLISFSHFYREILKVSDRACKLFYIYLILNDKFVLFSLNIFYFLYIKLPKIKIILF